MSDLYGEQYLSEEQEDFTDALFEASCTCRDCEDRFDCEFAFDRYNTNGDCLADK